MFANIYLTIIKPAVALIKVAKCIECPILVWNLEISNLVRNFRFECCKSRNQQFKYENLRSF